MVNSTLKKRKAITADVWEKHGSLLTRLYIKERKKAVEVLAIMKEDHEVTLTKSQLEGGLRKLKIRKYSRADNWRYIAREYADRMESGKESVVIVDGNRVEAKRLRKELARYSETVTERLFRRADTSHRSLTPPPCVIIRSPSPIEITPPLPGAIIRSLCPVQMNHPHSEDSAAGQWIFYHCYDLPWNQFQRYYDENNSSRSEQRVSYVQEEAEMDAWIHLDAFDSESSSFIVPSDFNFTITNILAKDARYFCFTRTCLDNNIIIRYLVKRMEALLPWTLEGELAIDVKSALGISTEPSRAAIFQLAIFILSNKYDTKSGTVGNIIRALLQFQRNRSLLCDLYSKNLATLKCFLNVLLKNAVRADDIKIVSFILGMMRANHAALLTHLYLSFSNRTDRKRKYESKDIVAADPFNVIIKLNTPKLVQTFLKNGAKVTWYSFLTAIRSHQSWITFATIRDLFARNRNEKSVTNALLVAAHSRNEEVFRHIIQFFHQPIRDKVRNDRRVTILEATAEYGCLEMVQYLLENVDAKDYRDGVAAEKALAAALAGPNFDTVKFLCGRGVKMSMRQTVALKIRSTSVYFEDRSRTPLAQAILSENVDIVEFALGQMSVTDLQQTHEAGTYRIVTALHVAAAHGHTNLVKRLIQAGASIHANCKRRSIPPRGYVYAKHDQYWLFQGGTVLEVAVQGGHADIVQILLRAGAKGEEYDRNIYPENSALATACEMGRIDMVSMLVNYGATPSDASLVESIRSCQNAVARWLLDHGASVARCWGEALMAAIGSGNLEMTRYLMDVAPIQPAGVQRVLNEAVYNGDFALVQLLLRSYPGHDQFGGLPWVDAKQPWAVEMARLLLAAGAHDINRCSDAGLTLLQKAARYGNVELARYLLDHGAGPNIQPQRGKDTALQYAIYRGPHEMVRLLLDAGADANGPPSSFGQTSLQWAIDKESCELVELLLKAGADVNVTSTNMSSRTALQVAVMTQSCELVKLLLDAGADVNAPIFRQGRTAFQLAVTLQSYKLVEMLLDAGADVNAPPAERNGRTALQVAAAHGNFSIARRLLQAGADVNAPRAWIGGYTALEAAATNGRLDMTRLFLEIGADITGHENGQYRRAVGLSWRHGHRELSIYLQEYKAARYGEEACQPLSKILLSIDVKRHEEREESLRFSSKVPRGYWSDDFDHVPNDIEERVSAWKARRI